MKRSAISWTSLNDDGETVTGLAVAAAFRGRTVPVGSAGMARTVFDRATLVKRGPTVPLVSAAARASANSVDDSGPRRTGSSP